LIGERLELGSCFNMAGTYPNASATPIPLFDSYLEFKDVE